MLIEPTCERCVNAHLMISKAMALDYIQLGTEVVLSIVRPNAKEVEWSVINIWS